MKRRQTQKREVTRFKLSLTVHPEVRKRLKIAAAEEGLSMQEKLHAILCHELALEHLALQSPEVAASA